MRTLVAAAALLASAGSVAAVPVRGKLMLRQHGGSGSGAVSFVAPDAGISLPASGSTDAPTHSGMTIELVSARQGRASVVVPPTAGWRASPPKRRVRAYRLRGPGGLRIVLRDGFFTLRLNDPPGMSFGQRHGAAGIRVRLGSELLCAWFAGGTVRADRPGLFVGKRSGAVGCGPLDATTTTSSVPPTSTTSTTTTTVPPGGCDGRDTLQVIERRIFDHRGCASATCHGSRTSGGLDLRPGAAYCDLVGVPVTNPRAAAADKKRVVPGDAAASFLSQKLRGTLAPGEGARMPLFATSLPALELALVDAWIAAGAPPTGVVPGAPCLPKKPDGHARGDVAAEPGRRPCPKTFAVSGAH